MYLTHSSVIHRKLISEPQEKKRRERIHQQTLKKIPWFRINKCAQRISVERIPNGYSAPSAVTPLQSLVPQFPFSAAFSLVSF